MDHEVVTGCGKAWCTGHAVLGDNTDRHVSTPAVVGERHVWLVQDEGREPLLLVTEPGSTGTARLSIAEAEAAGIDCGKLWPSA